MCWNAKGEIHIQLLLYVTLAGINTQTGNTLSNTFGKEFNNDQRQGFHVESNQSYLPDHPPLPPAAPTKSQTWQNDRLPKLCPINQPHVSPCDFCLQALVGL